MVIHEDVVSIGPQPRLRAQECPDLIEGRPPDFPNPARGNLLPTAASSLGETTSTWTCGRIAFASSIFCRVGEHPVAKRCGDAEAMLDQ